MIETDRNKLLGIGAGVAAAGLATVAGVAIDRLWRDREHAVALGTDEDFTVEPTSTAVVVADDGVPLHVEIDEPDEPVPGRPTIVLGHGYTLDLRCWVYQRRMLHEAGYRVVVWDKRGHGSSGTGEPSHNTVEQVGSDLHRLVDEVVPEGDLVLVGHSMGGMAIMALAEADPQLFRERVVGVALVSTSAGGLERVTWGMGKLLGGVVNRLGPVAMSTMAGRQEVVDSVMRGGRQLQEFLVDRGSFASPVPLSVVRLTADMIFGTTMEVMASYTPALNRHDKRAALANLDGVEVLVLNGDKDILTSTEHSDEIVELLPGADHVVVADAGHIIMLEHPQVVGEQILALARRAERAAVTPAPAASRATRGSRRRVTDLDKQRRDRATRPTRRRAQPRRTDA
ncbi:alpha/beta fold hydrolase [Ornithinicoccus hortensis]|uniref:Pimeloyl-ACP methyl ester carboxylesterase n=1 Tax=Ornithinicoccus hortensis TaxID=82346 RepID=A0A542YVA8_9MICO|nr:alpha/beta hydrolase [Ornithinicoccus hortensis]TQL52018.1 pimeloyl-ACP methyl ester carboxylesterase [Ornithinicoccus hortensis]